MKMLSNIYLYIFIPIILLFIHINTTIIVEAMNRHITSQNEKISIINTQIEYLRIQSIYQNYWIEYYSSQCLN